MAEMIYFKPASRTSEWIACTCNGIKTYQKRKGDIVTSEFCFVGREQGRPVSKEGDSGAPILDSGFRPVAMMWGGCQGFESFWDVTFATPLTVVLRDIERRMGWEKGSVRYC